MNRIWWIVGVVVVIFIAYFLIDHAKDAYKLLPMNTETEPKPDAYAMWYPYTNLQGGFLVEFPVPPQNATQNVAIPNANQQRKYDMFVSEQLDGTIYLVNVVTYPTEWTEEEVQETMLCLIKYTE